MPEISILMNAYNAELYLEEAINSIYNQTFNDWEIIFIDNCSIDQTCKIAQSYDNRLKYFKTNENIPLGEARNFGLNFVTGKYLTFLDTDDVWEKTKLEVQLKYINSSTAFVYSSVFHINSYGHIIRKTVNNKSLNIKSLLERYDINMHSTMINLNLISLKFNDNLKFCPDYEFFLNVVAQGFKFVKIDKPLVRYRIHENSLSNEVLNIQLSEIDFVLDNLKNQYPKLFFKFHKSFKVGRNKIALLINAKINLGNKKYSKASLDYFKLSRYNYKYLIFAIALSLPYINNKIGPLINGRTQ